MQLVEPIRHMFQHHDFESTPHGAHHTMKNYSYEILINDHDDDDDGESKRGKITFDDTANRLQSGT